MAEPRLRRKRIFAAAIESTPGTAETLDAGDAQFVAYDVEINPDIEFVERPAEQGSFSQPPGITAGEMGGITVTVEATPSAAAEAITIAAPKLQFSNVQTADRNKLDISDISFQCNKSADAGDDELTITFAGAGTIPSWAQVLLPACGFVAAGRVYSPTSEAPGSNVKTVTLGVYKDGTYYKLAGCAGTAVLRLENGQRAMIDFVFTGIWATPADATILAPTFPTLKAPRFKGSTVTITDGSEDWTPKVSEITIDLGNEVVMREDANQASGYAHAIIVDRKVVGTMNPEATLIANQTPEADWLNATEKVLSVVL